MNGNNLVIDCRSKHCSLRYKNIADDFKSIKNGESIHLITDSDPRKLFYELLSKERGNFYWIPLEDGPGEWDVMIEKSTNI